MTKPKWQTAERHGKTWHDRGPLWEQARRLYLRYPSISPAELADLLGVSRARFYACVEGLQAERAERHAAALASIKRKEGL
jgi:hypothetical protein